MDKMTQLNTWLGLGSLLVLLFLAYWLIKFIQYGIAQFGNRNVTNKQLLTVIEKTLTLFKPIAIILIVLDFISINYIAHCFIVIVVGVFGYKHVKNYINGIFIKVNPLIGKGALVSVGEQSGEIKSLLPFGLTLSTEMGEHFINYSTVEETGFSVNSNENSLLRQTLFLTTEMDKETLLDLLFDNPIISFSERPAIKTTESLGVLKLQYTLENGASNEDLYAFFKEQNIQSNSTHIISD